MSCEDDLEGESCTSESAGKLAKCRRKKDKQKFNLVFWENSSLFNQGLQQHNYLTITLTSIATCSFLPEELKLPRSMVLSN